MNVITLVDGARTLVLPAEASQGWIFHTLKDWYGLTGNKYPTIERPQAHGAYPPGRAVRLSRAISFKVAYRNGTPAEVEEAVSLLSSFGAEGPIVMIVEDALGRTQRTVTIDSIPDLDDTRRYTGDMTVNAVAEDPRRYAVDTEVPWQRTAPPTAGAGLVWPAVSPLVWPGGGTSGRITLTNTGLAPSAPMFRTLGGFSSTLITTVETGARVGLDRLVPDGSVAVIDTAEHRAMLDGQSDVSRWISWREWELIPAGQSRTYQFDVTAAVGSPILEGRVLSAWW